MITTSINSEESKLPNRTGLFTLFQDGNLPRHMLQRGPTVLVIGTASDGPSGAQFVTDLNAATKTYGTNGTLMKGAFEVAYGGAQNIVTLRLGAAPAVLTGIGNGGNSTTGITLTTGKNDDTAGRKMKFYYSKRTKSIQVWDENETLVYDNSPRCTRDVDSFQDTYTGVGDITVSGGTIRVTDSNRGSGLARPPWVDNALVGEYRAIPTDTSDTHYAITANGSNWFEVTAAIGATSNVRYKVGQPYTRCYGGFPGIFTTIKKLTTVGNDTYVFLNGYQEQDLETNDLKGYYLNPNVEQGETFLIKTATWNSGESAWRLRVEGNVSSVASVGDTCTAGNWKLKNPGYADDDYDAAAWAGAGTRCANRFCSNTSCPGYNSSNIDAGGCSVVTTGKWKDFGAYDIGGPDLSGGEHGAPVPMESAISYIASYGEMPGAINYMTYTAGTDGTNLTKRKLFEHLWETLEIAKGISHNYVYVPEAYADNPNIKYCARTDADEFDTSDDNYPGADTETTHAQFTKPDVLAWFAVYEGDDGKFYYAWDNGKAAPITNVTMTTADGRSSITVGNDPSDPTNVIDFHEVDFAYLLARYCYETSRDDFFVRSIVPFRPPAFSQQQINLWVGKAPTRDSNGFIKKNGRGLLGFPWTAGRITQGNHYVNFADGSVGNQEPGYFLTEGLFSDEPIMHDDNGAKINIGKYIALFPGYGIMNTGFRATSGGYYASGAGYAIGFSSTLRPNSGMTGKTAKGVRVAFGLSGKQISALNNAKLMVFKPVAGGDAEFNFANSAATDESDWQMWTTGSIVAAVCANLRAASKPFYGEPIAEAEEDALYGAWDKVRVNALKNRWITKMDYKWIVRDVDKVVGDTRVKITIYPTFELRRIIATVSLGV